MSHIKQNTIVVENLSQLQNTIKEHFGHVEGLTIKKKHRLSRKILVLDFRDNQVFAPQRRDA